MVNYIKVLVKWACGRLP